MRLRWSSKGKEGPVGPQHPIHRRRHLVLCRLRASSFILSVLFVHALIFFLYTYQYIHRSVREYIACRCAMLRLQFNKYTWWILRDTKNIFEARFVHHKNFVSSNGSMNLTNLLYVIPSNCHNIQKSSRHQKNLIGSARTLRFLLEVLIFFSRFSFTINWIFSLWFLIEKFYQFFYGNCVDIRATRGTLRTRISSFALQKRPVVPLSFAPSTDKSLPLFRTLDSNRRNSSVCKMRTEKKARYCSMLRNKKEMPIEKGRLEPVERLTWQCAHRSLIMADRSQVASSSRQSSSSLFIFFSFPLTREFYNR